MKKFINYLFIIIISIAFGYFWAYKAYTPHIKQLTKEFSAFKLTY